MSTLTGRVCNTCARRPPPLGQDTTACLDRKGDREECCELLASKHDMPGSGPKKEKGTKRDLEGEWDLGRESDYQEWAESEPPTE